MLLIVRISARSMVKIKSNIDSLQMSEPATKKRRREQYEKNPTEEQLSSVGSKRKICNRKKKRRVGRVKVTVKCEKHGAAENDFQVDVFKVRDSNGEYICKQCSVTDCDACGKNVPAHGGGQCVKCSQAIAIARKKKVKDKFGDQTDYDSKRPCKRHPHCTQRVCKSDQCVLCRKAGDIAKGTARNTQIKTKHLAPSQVTMKMLLEMEGKPCPTCGDPVNILEGARAANGFSCGRLDHDIGYIVGNVFAQHDQCNMIANVGTVEDARNRLERIYNFQVVKNGVIDAASLPIPVYEDFPPNEKGHVYDFYKKKASILRMNKVNCKWLTGVWYRKTLETQRGMCTICGDKMDRDDMSIDRTEAGSAYVPDACTLTHLRCNLGKCGWDFKCLVNLATTVHKRYFCEDDVK
jgi:hypothetical protein